MFPILDRKYYVAFLAVLKKTGLLFPQELDGRLQMFYAASVNDRRLGNCIPVLCASSYFLKGHYTYACHRLDQLYFTETAITLCRRHKCNEWTQA